MGRSWSKLFRIEKSERLRVGIVLVLFLGVALQRTVEIQNSVSDSKSAFVKSELATLHLALRHFHADCQRYPTSAEGLSALLQAPPDLAKLWKGPYIDKPLSPDLWQRPYQYRSDHGRFEVKSLGADGKPGGEGEASDLVVTNR